MIIHLKNITRKQKLITVLVVCASIIIGAGTIFYCMNDKKDTRKRASVSVPVSVQEVMAPVTQGALEVTPEAAAVTPDAVTATPEAVTPTPAPVKTPTPAPVKHKPVKKLPPVTVVDSNSEEAKEIDPEYKKNLDDAAPVSLEKPSGNLSYGVDVSHWQGTINWAKVKNAGIDFAIIKLGGRSIGAAGNVYMDGRYTYNISQALANGVKVGVYFFSQAITEQEAVEEASVVLANIKGYKITYPIVFDWEDGANFRGNKANLTKEQYVNIVKAFCETIENGGYEPMIYGNKYSTMVKYAVPALSGTYKFWLASYTNDLNTPPNYSGTYQMWQYTSSGKIDGIPGKVDLNVAYFSYGSGQAADLSALNLTHTSFITNLGQPVDFLAGVSAKDTTGKDISSKVTYTITDSAGVIVNNSQAVQKPGTYTVNYQITDFTGKTKSASASLTVRGIPAITVGAKIITVPATYTISQIEQQLKANVQARDYENNDITGSVKINGLTTIIPGQSYTITYQVTDSRGLSSSADVKLVIDNPTASPAPTISST